MEILAIPLSLIAMVGALFLLAKAQKDALHDVFKYASYFVITLCVFTLSMAIIHAFDHKKEKHMIKMMRGGSHEMEMHGMGGGHEDMMMFHQKMNGPGGCPHMKKGTCCEEEGDCEDGMDKKVIIKDTIIKK